MEAGKYWRHRHANLHEYSVYRAVGDFIVVSSGKYFPGIKENGRKTSQNHDVGGIFLVFCICTIHPSTGVYYLWQHFFSHN